jgi:membrane fusion protein (multidrug efflux system)
MHNRFLARHGRRIIAILALVAIVILLYFSMQQTSKKDDFRPMANIVQVSNVTVQDMPVQIRTLAQMLAIDDADIASEIDGVIESIHFEKGELVEKGKLLIQLNDANQTAKLEQAKAQENLASIDYERLKSLYARGASPKQELDKAEADLKVAQANVSLAQAELDKTSILAPFDGRLGVRNISAGQYVSQGQKLLDIVDKRALKIQYAVPQQHLAQLQFAAPVTFITAAFPGETFVGQVDFISPCVDMTTRTLLVEAVFANPDERLSPGLSGQIIQRLSVIEDALAIPEEALVPTITGYEVYEILDGHANAKSVEIGSRSGGMVHIKNGVTADDIIITQGQHNLRDGAPVEVLQLEQD